MVRQVQERFLDELPRFYFKGESGNLYLIHKSVSDIFDLMIKDKILVEASKKVIRPIQIWREQLKDSIYTINCRVQLEDIKQVQIYLDDVEDSLILDSGELEEGIDEYSNSIELTTPLIVPTEKYYIRVEDWLGNIYLKGIPENTTTLGDKYDVDPILDKFGSNWGVPRLSFTPPILPEDYRYTYPSYCLDIIEPDYYYEQRLLKFGEDIGTLRLTVIELYKYFMVYPEIMGRWRHLCRMGTGDPNEGFPGDFQNRKFMRSDEWNSAVFDVSLDIDSIPKNIDIPSEVEIAKMIEKVFPLSKKAYFALSSNEIVGNEEFLIHDLLEFDLFMCIDTLIQTEEFNWEEETAIYEYIPGFVYDELFVFLLTKVMSTRGQCLFPINPRFYPSEIPFLGEDGYCFTGDYFNGYLCEDGEEVPKTMIQSPPPPDYWTPMQVNHEYIFIAYDSLRVYGITEEEWIGQKTLTEFNCFELAYLSSQTAFDVYIDDTFFALNPTTGELADLGMIGDYEVTKSLPWNTHIFNDTIIAKVWPDSEWHNYTDMDGDLNVGEVIVDAMEFSDIYIVLTNQRVIYSYQDVVIDEISVTGALGFCNSDVNYVCPQGECYGVVTPTELVTFSIEMENLTYCKTQALPSAADFMHDFGFFNGMWVDGALLDAIGLFEGCIKAAIGISGHYYVLYDDHIIISEYNWGTGVWTEVANITLPESGAHDIGIFQYASMQS